MRLEQVAGCGALVTLRVVMTPFPLNRGKDLEWISMQMILDLLTRYKLLLKEPHPWRLPYDIIVPFRTAQMLQDQDGHQYKPWNDT